jgi:ribosomal-protein-alanine N-acetyltransferase
MTPALNASSWLRLIALSNRHDPYAVLLLLWREMQPMLREDGVKQVAFLAIHEWAEPYLPEMGFDYQEDVVTLHRERGSVLPMPQKPVIIQPAYSEHLQQIVALDQAAFAPPWQMTATDLYQARRHSAHYSIAMVNKRIAGFQISTRHQGAGHLARLAVHPSMQGKGIGAALVYDMIQKLEKRGADAITVNTQSSNLHSQGLYERYGFRRNGFDFPVWSACIS